jgi:hypothetical protein
MKNKRTNEAFYAVPSEDPSFHETQEVWYQKLEAHGFKDIEDHNVGGFELSYQGKISACNGGRPLKMWSGSPIHELEIAIDLDPLAPLQTNFPSQVMYDYERLLNSDEFEFVCGYVAKFANRYKQGYHSIPISKDQVKEIWILFIEGRSLREMQSMLDIYYQRIYRIIKVIKQWL